MHTPRHYVVAENGNDASDGSEQRPFRTLQHAADLVKPGDTVDLRRGNYVGFNLNSPGGSEDHPITFEAEPGAIIYTAAQTGPNHDSGINVEHPAGGTSWVVFKGFSIFATDGSMERAGIRLTACTHCQVLHCTIQNSAGNWGIFTSQGKDLLIEGNICKNSGGQHGIYVSRGGGRVVVRQNVLFGNHWDGLHMNGGTEGPIKDCLIENNVIFGNELTGMDCDGVQDSVFRNNLVYGNEKHAITLYNRDTASGCVGNTFVNNTLISRSMFALQMQPGSTANELFNNILEHTGPGVYGSIGVRGQPQGLVSDYNVVTDDFSMNLGLSHLTLAEWRQRTGQDAHSICVTDLKKLFANAAANNYHLRPLNSAAWKGAPKVQCPQAPTVDLDGKCRNVHDGLDVGAYAASTDN